MPDALDLGLGVAAGLVTLAGALGVLWWLIKPRVQEWATTQMLPAGRWNQPEDLVGAVLFLSSHLSDMVVGHVLMVDGGWTIH